MFKTVVVPIDGSKHAMKAAVAAIDLAAKYRSTLHFIVVTKRPTPRVSENVRRYMEIEHMLGTPEDVVAEMAQEVLRQATHHAGKKGLSRVKSVVLSGHPAREIVDFAKRAKADLIVMGSRGLGDIKGFMLGSVSHKVSSLAGCPCLVVR